MILQIVLKIKKKKMLEKIKETCLFGFCLFGLGGRFLDMQWMYVVCSILFWVYFFCVAYLIWTYRKEVGQLKLALKKYSGDLWVLALPLLLLFVKVAMFISA